MGGWTPRDFPRAGGVRRGGECDNLYGARGFPSSGHPIDPSFPAGCSPGAPNLGPAWTLGPAEGLHLLLVRLEPPVAELGGRVDELEGDLLERLPGGVLEERLPEGDAPLAGAHDRPGDHQVVALDDAVLGEPADGGDLLDGGVRPRGRHERVLPRLPNLVDLLVDLRPMVEPVLPRAGHRERD